jgi:hypothetical protein
MAAAGRAYAIRKRTLFGALYQLTTITVPARFTA